jgi:adenylosuccinate synthase
MSATIVLGAQWGDECKGKISAHLVQRDKVKYLYKAGIGPNAEHGIYWEKDGPYVKCNQLPLGFIRSPDVLVRIGPGVCVDVEKLFAEIKYFGLEGRVKVDPRCPIVKPEHKQWERENLKGGSTYNGCGPCRSEFILRKALQARDIPELKDYLLDVPEELNKVAKDEKVVIECSQGALLSLALSYDYPSVTSDNVTTCAAMDDVGLDWRLLESVVMVVKSMPTRESSGPMGGVDEMSDEELQQSGLLYEDSSIDGGKRRKIKGIDFKLLEYASKINGPTEIALTFLDHYDSEMKDVTDKTLVTEVTTALMDKVAKATQAKISMLETGKLYNSIIDLA